MEKLWHLIGRTAGVTMMLLGFLFVVYFWNLDKKLFSAVKRMHRHGNA